MQWLCYIVVNVGALLWDSMSPAVSGADILLHVWVTNTSIHHPKHLQLSFRIQAIATFHLHQRCSCNVFTIFKTFRHAMCTKCRSFSRYISLNKNCCIPNRGLNYDDQFLYSCTSSCSSLNLFATRKWINTLSIYSHINSLKNRYFSKLNGIFEKQEPDTYLRQSLKFNHNIQQTITSKPHKIFTLSCYFPTQSFAIMNIFTNQPVSSILCR